MDYQIIENVKYNEKSQPADPYYTVSFWRRGFFGKYSWQILTKTECGWDSSYTVPIRYDNIEEARHAVAMMNDKQVKPFSIKRKVVE